MTNSLLETFSRYIPALITHRLTTDPTPIATPTMERFPAAVLFADISGFTALTEKLAERGLVGVEELSQILNDYFGQLIDLILANGGDVVKFAGDGLIALWPVHPTTANHVPVLPEATLRAARCSQVVQEQLNAYKVSEGIHLSLKLMVGAGEIETAHLGGVYGRWEFLVTGEALMQVGQASRQARPGDIILSSAAHNLIGKACIGEILATGDMRLKSVLAPVEPLSMELPHVPHNAESAVCAYIPGAIVNRLAAGQSGWVAELRRVTVLFIGLPDLNSVARLDQAQAIIQSLQTALYRYEGSINKLGVDDKGVTLLAAMGLPPLAHEDDAVRGVQTALAMQAELKAIGAAGTIGVATGRAFCGAVGNDKRCEYTMLGDVVNVAARLMQTATTMGAAILCDEVTYQATQATVSFTGLPPVKVKGKAEVIAVYQPQGRRKKVVEQATKLIGRQEEMAVLVEAMQAVLDGRSQITFIEGEAGIGKSRLVEEAAEKARGLGITTFWGAGDAIEKSTPYYAWRLIFYQLFGLETVPETEQQEHILEQLADRTQLLPLVPLLNVVLSLDLPDNDFTRQLQGEVRAENTQALLVNLLQMAATRSAILLVMEDAHWLDSASWAVLRRVSREVQPLCLVIATRPLSAPQPVEYNLLRQAAGTRHLPLEALTTGDALSLVAQRLGVTSLPEPVAQLIQEKAEGHPFFSEELAYALRDAGLIEIVDGNCYLTADVDSFAGLAFPDTIEGVITSRIDRLTPQQQLVLKVASVIGRIFTFHTLYDIHPIEADKPFLGEYLDNLEQLDITPLETPHPNLTYIFKHIITQEVAYNLMAFAQRRQLHRTLAEWYEAIHHDDLERFYPLLAYHWNQAEVASRAIDYLEKAGEQAWSNFVNEEAVRFFTQALSLVQSQPEGETAPTAARLAHWHSCLAQAYEGLGLLRESREHALQALTLLSRPMPDRRGKVITGLIKQLAQQAVHRLWPQHFVIDEAKAAQISQEKRRRLQTISRTYGSLAQAYYTANENLPFLYIILDSLNLTEQAGPSAELAASYAAMCFTAGLVPWHSLAETYSQCADKVAHIVNQPYNLAYVWSLTSAYKIGIGRWEEAATALEKAADIYKRLGSHAQWGTCLINLAVSDLLTGNSQRSRELLSRVYEVASRRHNPLQQGWSLNWQALDALRQDQIDRAVTLLQEALSLLAENPDRIAEVDVYGQLAVARLRLGETAAARQAADIASERIAHSALTAYHLWVGYSAVAEVYLQLWQQSLRADGIEQAALASQASQACRQLHRFRRVFPIGGPVAWRLQGLHDWLSGRSRRALSAWHKSLAAAKMLKMPHEEGLAHYELGRHLDRADSRRDGHLNQAREIFSRINATYDLIQLQREREQPASTISQKEL